MGRRNEGLRDEGRGRGRGTETGRDGHEGSAAWLALNWIELGRFPGIWSGPGLWSLILIRVRLRLRRVLTKFDSDPGVVASVTVLLVGTWHYHWVGLFGGRVCLVSCQTGGAGQTARAE
jgi:hypothetical protein